MPPKVIQWFFIQSALLMVTLFGAIGLVQKNFNPFGIVLYLCLVLGVFAFLRKLLCSVSKSAGGEPSIVGLFRVRPILFFQNLSLVLVCASGGAALFAKGRTPDPNSLTIFLFIGTFAIFIVMSMLMLVVEVFRHGTKARR